MNKLILFDQPILCKNQYICVDHNHATDHFIQFKSYCATKHTVTFWVYCGDCYWNEDQYTYYERTVTVGEWVKIVDGRSIEN